MLRRYRRLQTRTAPEGAACCTGDAKSSAYFLAASLAASFAAGAAAGALPASAAGAAGAAAGAAAGGAGAAAGAAPPMVATATHLPPWALNMVMGPSRMSPL